MTEKENKGIKEAEESILNKHAPELLQSSNKSKYFKREEKMLESLKNESTKRKILRISIIVAITPFVFTAVIANIGIKKLRNKLFNNPENEAAGVVLSGPLDKLLSASAEFNRKKKENSNNDDHMIKLTNGISMSKERKKSLDTLVRNLGIEDNNPMFK